MELLVKNLANSIKCTEQELRSALGKLGFQIVSKKRQIVVSGTVKHALLNDGAEITALLATKELAAIATEFSKTIIEIATFVAEYKGAPNQSATDASDLAEETASTIEDEIELDELEEQTLADIDTAEQAIFQRETNKNTAFSDVGGVLLEADLIIKLQEARAKAWENPNSRKALEGLINQGSQHRLNSLLGKSTRNGVLKLKSLRNILKPTSTVDTTSTEVIEDKLPPSRTTAPLKVLAQAATSTPNSNTTAQ